MSSVTLRKCNTPELSLGSKLYHWHWTLPSFLCCGFKYMWKTGKSLGSLEICVALSAFPLPFCSAYSLADSWIRPRLHNLLLVSGISNRNKLEWPKITSKVTNESDSAKKKKKQSCNDLQCHNLRPRPGAPYLEPATPIISQCNGIFTDQSIFRYFSRELGQFQSTWARFGRDKTMRPHVNMSVLVHACYCNWPLTFLWGSGFEINLN